MNAFCKSTFSIFSAEQGSTYSSLCLELSGTEARFSMLIFLPKVKSIAALDDFIRDEFNDNLIYSTANSGYFKTVEIELPKMSFEGSYRMTEVNVIIKMLIVSRSFDNNFLI